jgi:hypothetical protein
LPLDDMRTSNAAGAVASYTTALPDVTRTMRAAQDEADDWQLCVRPRAAVKEDVMAEKAAYASAPPLDTYEAGIPPRANTDVGKGLAVASAGFVCVADDVEDDVEVTVGVTVDDSVLVVVGVAARVPVPDAVRVVVGVTLGVTVDVTVRDIVRVGEGEKLGVPLPEAVKLPVLVEVTVDDFVGVGDLVRDAVTVVEGVVEAVTVVDAVCEAVGDGDGGTHTALGPPMPV